MQQHILITFCCAAAHRNYAIATRSIINGFNNIICLPLFSDQDDAASMERRCAVQDEPGTHSVFWIGAVSCKCKSEPSIIEYIYIV